MTPTRTMHSRPGHLVRVGIAAAANAFVIRPEGAPECGVRVPE